MNLPESLAPRRHSVSEEEEKEDETRGKKSQPPYMGILIQNFKYFYKRILINNSLIIKLANLCFTTNREFLKY